MKAVESTESVEFKKKNCKKITVLKPSISGAKRPGCQDGACIREDL